MATCPRSSVGALGSEHAQKASADRTRARAASLRMVRPLRNEQARRNQARWQERVGAISSSRDPKRGSPWGEESLSALGPAGYSRSARGLPPSSPSPEPDVQRTLLRNKPAHRGPA